MLVEKCEMLVIQPTSFCNIDCKYCYLPNRNLRDVMSLDTLDNVIKNLVADDVLAAEFEIVWHAGEPLSAGIEFYKNAQKIIKQRIPNDKVFHQIFQTNATLLSDDWCEFFDAIQAGVGISLDGPRHLHDANRISRNGGGTFDRVMRGVNTLRNNGVDFYVISVVSEEGLGSPESLIDFAIEADIGRICFNFEESDGIHVSNMMKKGIDKQDCRRFFDYLVNYSANNHGKIWIREISDMFNFIIGTVDVAVESRLVEPFRMITITNTGQWSTFCPELAATSSERFGDFFFGDLSLGPISQQIDRDKFATIHDEINRGVELCKSQCSYFKVCKGGRPANKYGEHRRFDVSETEQCRATVMALADSCAAHLNYVLSANAK